MASTCVPSAAIAACAGMSDGASCSIAGLPNGVCSGGLCVAPGCGNGVVEAGEICDDGNTIAGDGCAADCSARDTCPPIGTTPKFSALVHQPIVQQCTDYTTSRAGGIGVATCYDGNTNGTAAGAIDGALTFIPSLVDPTDPHRHPALAPEGDELFLTHQVATGYAIVAYHAAGGDWTFAHTLAGPTYVTPPNIGTPTTGVVRHMPVILDDGTLHEYTVTSTGAVTDLGAYTAQILGVQNIYSRPNMTPDGLRLAFTGYDSIGMRMFYTDRASIDDRFRPAEEITGVPPTSDGYMTENCARIYFSAISSIFYVQQQ